MSLKLAKVPIYILIAITVTLVFTAVPVSAQETDSDKIERERELQAELEKVLKEIASQKKELQEQRSQSASIQEEIAVLDAQIRETQLQLEASRLRINQLSNDIQVKAETISELEDKTLREKESLSRLLQKMREVDDSSMIEVFLANENLSDFFKDSDSLRTLKQRILEDLERIAEYQEAAAEQKAKLEMVKNEQENITYQIEKSKEKIQVSQQQKEQLLSASKEKEQTYEEIVAERQARASEIRSALFSLRDTGDINFGQALDYARIAEEGTGVRPAFLLAIITQESNLGQNVGRCNLPSTPNRTWKEIMKPDRDHAPYLRIMDRLGLDPNTQPLSCPIGNIGWGGAMGPSQFIPSTWEMYQSRVSSVTGVSPSNPWNPRDAFTASSLFLKDLGAAARTYDAEWEAAARYYAGGGWQTRGVNYANSVMNIASRLQSQIDTLESL
ncbi:MAG: lytic murein transglycosylase [Candidatus Campbellbacteria bacterium]|nr:lytic murein transglycosylase [Candidatus Campbellbacteria bacterium]